MQSYSGIRIEELPSMMFTTPVHVQPGSVRIAYPDKLLIMGSCFAEEVGNWLVAHRFNALINPFGISFNPLSLAGSWERMMDHRLYSESELVAHNGFWHSMDHHGVFSGRECGEVVGRINHSLELGREYLLTADWIIITLGSAWVYERKNKIVANCHKLPSGEFVRRLVEHAEIVSRWNEILERFRNVNPTANVILTVSPVRYLRYGATENQLSKAHLLIAAEKLSKGNGIHYFPSYEIMMDELRDYRFWAQDMAHPSALAVEYILGKFRDAWMESKDVAKALKLDPWIRLKGHRPIHESPEESAKRIERAEMEMKHVLNGE